MKKFKLLFVFILLIFNTTFMLPVNAMKVIWRGSEQAQDFPGNKPLSEGEIEFIKRLRACVEVENTNGFENLLKNLYSHFGMNGIRIVCHFCPLEEHSDGPFIWKPEYQFDKYYKFIIWGNSLSRSVVLAKVIFLKVEQSSLQGLLNSMVTETTWHNITEIIIQGDIVNEALQHAYAEKGRVCSD